MILIFIFYQMYGRVHFNTNTT